MNVSWEKLNDFARQWYALDPATDAARRKTLEVQLSTGLNDFLWKGEDVSSSGSSTNLDFLPDLWFAFINNFDPAKSTFEAFVKDRLSYLRKDALYENSHRITETDPFTGEKTRRRVFDVSLSAQDEDGETKEIIIPDNTNPGSNVNVEGILDDLTILIINLKLRLSGRKNTDTTIRYYQMFFTDGITQAIQEATDWEPYFCKERDILSAAHHGFMDFFLTAKCRSVREIAMSDTKLFGELVSGEEMTEAPRPLPADVYIAFLCGTYGIDVSRQAISNQRAAYRQLLRQENVN